MRKIDMWGDWFIDFSKITLWYSKKDSEVVRVVNFKMPETFEKCQSCWLDKTFLDLCDVQWKCPKCEQIIPQTDYVDMVGKEMDGREATRKILEDIIELGVSDLMRHSMQWFMGMGDKKQRQDTMERLCIHIFGEALQRIRDWNQNN